MSTSFNSDSKCKIASLLAISVVLGCICKESKGQLVQGLDRDSLKSIIRNMPDDTAKALTLITLGQQYESNLPDSAAYFYDRSKELSTRINYPAGFIRYVNNYTAILNVQGRFDESLQLHREALAVAEKNKLEALRLKTLVNIGVVYQYQSNYQAAADHYLNNLSFFEKVGDQQSLSLLYSNLSALYRNLHQLEKSLQYGLKSLEIAEKQQDLFSTGMVSNNIANVLKELGRMKEAAVYIDKAYRIATQINNIDMQESALINRADLLSKTEKPDVYIPVFEKVIPLADSVGDISGKVLAMQGISFGLFRQKQFTQAEQMVLKALPLAREHEQKEAESVLLLLMSDVQIALGNLEKARRFRNEYDSVNTVLLNKDLLENVQELETKYEVEKKQSMILRQELLLVQKNRESLRQRLWLTVSIAGLVVMGLLLFLGLRYYRQRQKLNRQAMEALQTEQENLRLKSLLEGQVQERQRISQEMHDDMGSGLTSMLFLARTVKDQDMVADRLKNTAEGLVQKMNEIIWSMNKEQDTLESLVAYMRKHIAEVLDTAGIAYRFNVEDPLTDRKISQEFRRNIYLCAKEAAHNIIRHAGATEVSVDIQAREELKVSITDNGIGIVDPVGSRFGNGLKNMRQRMESINGKFEIRALPQRGTQVILSAPFAL